MQNVKNRVNCVCVGERGAYVNILSDQIFCNSKTAVKAKSIN